MATQEMESFTNITQAQHKKYENFEWVFSIKTNLYEQRNIRIKSQGENSTHAKNSIFKQIVDISKYGTPVLYIYENGNKIIITPNMPNTQDYKKHNSNDCEYAEITYDILYEFSKTIDQTTIDRIKATEQNNLQETVSDILKEKKAAEFNINAQPFIPSNDNTCKHNEYNSEYVNEYVSEYVNEYVSEYNSEYDYKYNNIYVANNYL